MEKTNTSLEFTEIEGIITYEYGISLERLGKTFFKEPILITAFDGNGDEDKMFEGLCSFYFPLNIGQGEKFEGSFGDRIIALATGNHGILENYIQDTFVTLQDKKNLNSILRQGENTQKTSLFDNYIKKYNKDYPIVMIGDLISNQ
ncbi:hypothetical protein GF336_04745 [Candidatus Woesearchaeota archaeon]|nr:hypothetical protein [Candidatus Woesearchaeota archaeon]